MPENMVLSAVTVLGKIGLPDSIRNLASRTWDVVVVGAGHNALTYAAYLARASKRVLVKGSIYAARVPIRAAVWSLSTGAMQRWNF
jgi:hypothetical protein